MGSSEIFREKNEKLIIFNNTFYSNYCLFYYNYNSITCITSILRLQNRN